NMNDEQRSQCRANGVVPRDFADSVAEDYPELIEIVRRRVKPERDKVKTTAVRKRWWQYEKMRAGLYAQIRPLEQVLAVSRHSHNWAITFLPNDAVYAESLVVFALPHFG